MIAKIQSNYSQDRHNHTPLYGNSSQHRTKSDQTTNPKKRNDLLVERLADGGQHNILCELDTWHCFATAEARARVNQRFPNSNAFCAAMMAMDSVPCLVTPTILLLKSSTFYLAIKQPRRRLRSRCLRFPDFLLI